MPLNVLDENGTVRCPICNLDFNHIQRVFTRMGSDASEAEVYEGTSAYGTDPSVRRSALIIELKCESDHVWQLRLQQHKGMISVTAVGV